MKLKSLKVILFPISERVINWLNKVRQDKNVVMFLIFLVISTGFWFLNALRKDYTATLTYPVRLINIPSNKMIPDDFNREINVKVRAGGFDIMRYRLSNSFLPLTFDVSRMKPVEKGGREGAFVLTHNESTRIVGQLSQGMQLVELAPDTLFVPLITRVTRKVPVVLQSQMSFQQQYTQSGPWVIAPDSVEVSGLEGVVDTVSFIPTTLLSLKELADTIQTSVLLDLPKGVSGSFRKVSVMIPVEPFTELNLKVPIEIQGLPDSLRIKTFPSEVQISFHVGVSNFGKITRSQFKALVDVSPVFMANPPTRLKVNLAIIPDGVKAVKFSPIFVEYLLEKKR